MMGWDMIRVHSSKFLGTRPDRILTGGWLGKDWYCLGPDSLATGAFQGSGVQLWHQHLLALQDSA